MLENGSVIDATGLVSARVMIGTKVALVWLSLTRGLQLKKIPMMSVTERMRRAEVEMNESIIGD